jgi:hypothetical protein
MHHRQAAAGKPNSRNRMSLKERLARFTFQKVVAQQERKVWNFAERLFSKLHGAPEGWIGDHALHLGDWLGLEVIHDPAAGQAVIRDIRRDDREAGISQRPNNMALAGGRFPNHPRQVLSLKMQ